ncbi:Mur ligase family protein [Bifidobacterium eulemuris]|uniref:Lipid II isoglutaminyl synthase (glutamine-hydrolyzing) subunit MurT n=1 Tax=Bifidobacterium eulemuris TaxID=1765219 RepID=A0A261GDJ3_9BIFI|nr:Mur ligase family protein [Bifidobacterium eulemuris]OZG69512.1 glutamate ligase [Bifidobacterium eulemuris]QOL32135.1 DUF1727 domain-containing protein [Bifidobacterium eulemuris]
MAVFSFATPLIGKTVRSLARLTRHGGSAFPGKVAERLDPGFLARTLAQLPYGVVLVSGTNGKTTTTRMVAMMLEDLGFKVFTNPTGSNFTRGVVSALLQEVSLGGRLDADIAVLELDEAYAVHFVRQVKPRYALLLNVMRDQLDRFGEIDNTARLLGHVAEATTGTVVLNREDPRVAKLAELVPNGTEVRYFGLADDLTRFFPSDDEMATTVAASEAATPTVSSAGHDLTADVTLMRVADHAATFAMDGETYETSVKLEGVYNLYNAAAALAIVRSVVRDAGRSSAVPQSAAARRSSHADQSAPAQSAADNSRLVRAVAQVTPAFGRGEVIDVNGSPVELLLVKNPMGFRLSLASFAPEGCDTMIAINDEYADGRDMSWLWDVDFSSLRGDGVSMVSGVRAWDMALRLGYDEVPVAQVEPDVEAAVVAFVNANPGKPKHMYCTYTAMLAARAALGRVAKVSDAGVGR